MADEGVPVRSRNAPSIDSRPGGATSLQCPQRPVVGRLRPSVGETDSQVWLPLEVGPTPPALRPGLVLVLACMHVRQATRIASKRPVKARLSVAGRARSRVQHRQCAACKGTSLRHWSCGLCDVRACACGVRVRRRVRASTPSVAARQAIGGESASRREPVMSLPP